MNRLLKVKRVYNKRIIVYTIIVILAVIIGSLYVYYVTAPQRTIKQYLKIRYNYTYNNIEKRFNDRKKVLDSFYINETEKKDILINFMKEVHERKLSSQLVDYNIKSLSKSGKLYRFIVTAISYTNTAVNDSNFRNETSGILTVKRCNFFNCIITEIVAIQDAD